MNETLSQKLLDDLNIQLWLDDLRPPPDGWVWARTAPEAIEILLKGNVGQMSLDHDLGEEAGVGCGNDVVVWLENEVGEGRWPRSIPQMTVHSANPVARARMLQAIASIHRLRPAI
jgi:hypothetical protein